MTQLSEKTVLGYEPTHRSSLMLSIIIPSLVFLSILWVTVYFAQRQLHQTALIASESTQTQAVISGNVHMSGYMPIGVTITIGERVSGSGNFTTVTTSDAFDGATWSWHGGQNNVLYDIQAEIKQNGRILAESNILTVAAPARNEVLQILSKVKAPSVKAEISGQVNINGYIPPNSTVNMLSRPPNETQFTVVQSNISQQHIFYWGWVTSEGVPYEMQAVLKQNGVTIAASAIQRVVAPSQSEVFIINSPAKAPIPSQVGLTGTFNINGLIPANSTTILAVRPTGTTAFTTVTTDIPAVDNGVWNWSNAKEGARYDLQASIVSNGKIVAVSPVITVTAPSVASIIPFNIVDLSTSTNTH